MSSFPDSYTHSKSRTKVKYGLFNYPRKSDLKSATDADTSKFAKKTDLCNLKSAVEKVDIDKLKVDPDFLLLTLD